MHELESSPNPYAAPQAPLAPSGSVVRTWFGRIVEEWYHGNWPLVFLLNLGVPVILGFSLCSNIGFSGVVLTILALLMLTTWIVSRDHRLRQRWLTGGKIVGLMQLYPLVHMFLGMSSITMLVHLGLVLQIPQIEDSPPVYEPIDFWPACLLTLMVGGGLLGLAFLVGWMIPHRPREVRETAAS
jgi:hypothetical protein